MEIELRKYDDFTVIQEIPFEKKVDQYRGEFIPCVNQNLNEEYLYRPYNFSMINFDGNSYLSKSSEYNNSDRITYPYPNPSSQFKDDFKAYINFSNVNPRPTLGTNSARDLWMPFYYNSGMVDRNVGSFFACFKQPQIFVKPFTTKYCFLTSQLGGIEPLLGKTPSETYVSAFEVYEVQAVGTIPLGVGDGGQPIAPFRCVSEPDEPAECTLYWSEEKGRYQGEFKVTFLLESNIAGSGPTRGTLTLHVKIFQTYAYSIPAFNLKINQLDKDLTERTLILNGGLNSAPNEELQYKEENYLLNINANTIETVNLIYNFIDAGTTPNIRPNWGVYRIWDYSGNLITELHSVFDDGFNKFNINANKENLNQFLSFCRGYGVNAFSYGATISDKIRISGANIDKNFPIFNLDNYYINVSSNEPLDLFSITDGAYCALINPISKIVYFILLGSDFYYELDLNPFYENRIDFFGFSINEKCIYLGTQGNSQPTNKYVKLIINLKFNFPKLIFNPIKLNFSFIPCQTHCLGKGGIFSKV